MVIYIVAIQFRNLSPLMREHVVLIIAMIKPTATPKRTANSEIINVILMPSK